MTMGGLVVLHAARCHTRLRCHPFWGPTATRSSTVPAHARSCNRQHGASRCYVHGIADLCNAVRHHVSHHPGTRNRRRCYNKIMVRCQFHRKKSPVQARSPQPVRPGCNCRQTCHSKTITLACFQGSETNRKQCFNFHLVTACM